MKIQDIRLGKIGDHICTNRKIKLRENRRNKDRDNRIYA
jgi:hypothetical protein